MNDKSYKCWYCNTNQADLDCSHDYEMHKLTKRKGSFIGVGMNVKTEFLNKTVIIPRCKECLNLNRKSGMISLTIFFFLITVIFILAIMPGANESSIQKFTNLVVLIICGSPVLLLIGWICGKIIHNNLRDDDDYPEVVTLMDDGWEFGSNPSFYGEDYER